jgi:hypothetical protein
MKSIQIIKLSLLLIIIIVFSSTCTTTATQPFQTNPVTSTNIALAEVTSAGTTDYTPGASIDATSTITPTAYLPFVENPAVKFIGIYLDHYWTKDTIPALQQVDQAAGKKHTSVGWFIDLEDKAFTNPDGNNLIVQLEELWNAGYISFINLSSNATSQDIIDGKRDIEIGYAAQYYKAWVDQGGGRRAMIAPLEEMNGTWTAYGKDPNTSDQFKNAYRHILGIFANKGITRNQVWWVFAPNGYNDADKPSRMFENYYPGDDVVDIVGFSAYNYGFCPGINPNYRRWESYPQIFEPYIARMQVMAPLKPIIIAETASTAYYHDDAGNPSYDLNQMSQWMIENYNYFAARSGVIGVYYFSFPVFDGLDSCAIEINPNGEMLSGYVTAVSNPVYKYLNVDQMNTLIH